jgi:Protein of unknown function (DUF2510)
MFGSKHREQKAAAEKERARVALLDAVNNLIATAEGHYTTDPDWPLVLKHGEHLVSTVQGAGLFEPRRGPGHWEGRSAGVSVPVPDTRLRVRVGTSAGTYVQGAETPTTIDTGNVSITTERIVFQGVKYTREWDYSKLIGIVHYSDKPASAIQVSNREKTSGIVYAGTSSTEPVRLAITVAVAIFNGETADTIQELHDEQAKLQAAAIPSRPAPVPSGPTPPPQPAPDTTPTISSPTTAPTPPPPGPEWARDPSGRHQYRWWDGTSWTDHVADNGQESADPL